MLVCLIFFPVDSKLRLGGDVHTSALFALLVTCMMCGVVGAADVVVVVADVVVAVDDAAAADPIAALHVGYCRGSGSKSNKSINTSLVQGKRTCGKWTPDHVDPGPWTTCHQKMDSEPGRSRRVDLGPRTSGGGPRLALGALT